MSSHYYELGEDGKQDIPNSCIIDWHRGILNQLGILDSCYLEWVDHPVKNNTKIRMFDSDILESMSFTPWWVVPSFYIPFALLELMKSVTDCNVESPDSSPLLINATTCHTDLVLCFSLVIFFIGVQGWTLFEYMTHRFLFHLEPDTTKYVQLVMHFLGHGVHHVTPTDSFRLVFPPAISFPLSLIFRAAFYAIFPPVIAAAFTGGFIFGYACYESVHYLTHHCTQDAHPIIHYLLGHYLANRDKWHSMHHYCDNKLDKLFGVTSQVWDVVFDTM